LTHDFLDRTTEKPKCAMWQSYDSRAASSSDCTVCSSCGSSSCPPRLASCSTCCAAGSWLVATHAASNLGVATARPQALARADGGTRGP